LLNLLPIDSGIEAVYGKRNNIVTDIKATVSS